MSPLSQPTRSYTPARQQSTCLLFTACIWIHTCQGIQPGISVNNFPHSKKHGSRWPQERGDIAKTYGTLFLTMHCYSGCLLTAICLPHAAQMTPTAPSIKTMPVFISRRDALVTSTSLLKWRNTFPRGLWWTPLFFHWTNGIT